MQSRYLRRFKSFDEIKEMTENPDAKEAELRRMVARTGSMDQRRVVGYGIWKSVSETTSLA